MSGRGLGIRWTIGDVSEQGFQALRLSLWGAWRIFGSDAAYVVCVNSIPLERAQALTGPVPRQVMWFQSRRELIPAFLAPHLDPGLAEGVAWKFSPLRFFADRRELSLDNDCILWGLPTALRAWLATDDSETCLIAADVRPCFGRFAPLCGPEPRNSGIRGLPAGFDLEAAFLETLERMPVIMDSELDEQGLQVAAVSLARPPFVVGVDEVSICSPFPPHLPYLGTRGAHFVGLNAKCIPWSLADRPAEEHIREHWRRHRETVREYVGLPPEGADAYPEARMQP